MKTTTIPHRMERMKLHQTAMMVTIVALLVQSAARAAEPPITAGARIEVDGETIGGNVAVREGKAGETRQQTALRLTKDLSRYPILFRKGYRVPADADDPDSATLEGSIRIVSQVQGIERLMAAPGALELVRRKGEWVVDHASLDRALDAAPEREITVELEMNSGGWSLEIREIRETKGELWVISKLRGPAPDLNGTMALGTEKDAVTVAAPELPVRHLFTGEQPDASLNNQSQHFLFAKAPEEFKQIGEIRQGKLLYKKE